MHQDPQSARYAFVDHTSPQLIKIAWTVNRNATSIVKIAQRPSSAMQGFFIQWKPKPRLETFYSSVSMYFCKRYHFVCLSASYQRGNESVHGQGGLFCQPLFSLKKFLCPLCNIHIIFNIQQFNFFTEQIQIIGFRALRITPSGTWAFSRWETLL